MQIGTNPCFHTLVLIRGIIRIRISNPIGIDECNISICFTDANIKFCISVSIL